MSMTARDRVLTAANGEEVFPVPVDVFENGIHPKLEGNLLQHYGLAEDDHEELLRALGACLRWARRRDRLENIHQFILDLDELDYIEFLYPSDFDFAEELDKRDAEAKEMLENSGDSEATLRDLDRGKIKIQ